MAIKPSYYVSETLSNLRRNLLMTFTAVLTVLISLFMLGGVLFLREMVNNVTLQFRGNVQLSVFLRNDITQAQFTALDQKIRSSPDVKDVRYLSHDDAYQEFKQLFQDEPDIVNAVSPDTLPASFRISVKNPTKESVEALGQSLQGELGVDEVKYAQKLVERLFAFTRVVWTLGLIVVIVLALASVLLIANTIRLAIFARRREIGVMKLVGATNWFIRIPFMIEGMLEGLFGGAFAFAAVWATKTVFLGRLRQSLPFLQGIYVGPGQLFQIFVVTVAVGGIVGGVGSAIALRRFLDV
jgi:cell division transport system permease protein